MMFLCRLNHRMDALKNKTRTRALTEEDVNYCELEHGTIFEDDGVEERLVESLMNFWKSSYQQNDVLIRQSMGDENLNIFEINELCMFAGVTCDEPCEVVLEVNEEE